MIFVTVGASQFPFDRLLQAVDRLATRETLIVQHGPSSIRPEGSRCVDFLPFQAVTELIREARIVVTHAGVGSILLSLANDKRPFVVPRLRAFGETVDDHQPESARRFARAGLVTLVEDPRSLTVAILERGVANGAPPAGTGEASLVADLRAYLENAVGSAAKPTAR